jgi:hypothetical protein
MGRPAGRDRRRRNAQPELHRLPQVGGGTRVHAKWPIGCSESATSERLGMKLPVPDAFIVTIARIAR